MVKQTANFLTLSRIILIPFFLISMSHSFQNSSFYFFMTIILYGLVCLTDYADGKLARHLKIESGIGQKLDLLADALFILSSVIFLTHCKMLPIWAAPMIFAKLVEFTITSKILAKGYTPVFDPTGRVAAILFYALPLWAFILQNLPLATKSFLLFTVAITALSSVIRIASCLKTVVLTKMNTTSNS